MSRKVKMTTKYLDPSHFEKAIDALPSNSALGPDGISSNLIKELKSLPSRILSVIYNSMLDEGYLPDILKFAFITMVS